MRAEKQQPFQKRHCTDANVMQSTELRPVEDECAEAQLSSREHNDDQDKAMPFGTVIVGQ